MGPTSAATFSCFLIKVASRCNLACDYCYMYEHADQTWRDQPRFMSSDTVDRLAERLAEYANDRQLHSALILLHGGEPLLAGAERLTALVDLIRSKIPEVRVDASVQTNGLLLSEDMLGQLANSQISVSLSIDGPQHAQRPPSPDDTR